MVLDLAIRGGQVLAMDPQIPRAEAVGIRGDRIVAVGTWHEVESLCESKTVVLDAVGNTILPAFTDAHIHLLDYARGFVWLALEHATSLEDCVSRVRAAHAETHGAAWILGRGWNHDEWSAPRWPHRRDLDDSVGDRKVFLVRKDGHSAWLSTAALKACKLWEPGEHQAGLRCEDGPGRRHPTGLVQEHALDAAWRGIPELPEETTRECLLRACRHLNSLGITAVHDCGGGSVVPRLRRLEEEGLLTLRCWATVSPEALPRLDTEQGWRESPHSMVRVGGLKIFADGSLGSRTAYLVDPYDDDTSTRGVLLLSREQLSNLMTRAAEKDLSLVAHVIGDGALRELLDAAEGHAGTPPSIRLEHLQLLHPDDVPRLARHPFIASMQPYHLSTDVRVAARAWGGRCRFAYAWATVAARVSVLAFGSDCPVEPPDPRLGLWAAVTRKGADGRSRGGWFPQERLTLTQALSCYTRGGAAASGDLDTRGSIERGKLADLVVMEGMLTDGEESEIRERRIVLTVLGGKVVHGEDSPA
jgi:predicted amidohydrolase YtcJ